MPCVSPIAFRGHRLPFEENADALAQLQDLQRKGRLVPLDRLPAPLQAPSETYVFEIMSWERCHDVDAVDVTIAFYRRLDGRGARVAGSQPQEVQGLLRKLSAGVD